MSHAIYVKTRRQAHDDGDVKYNSGLPCKRGHLCLRYVRNNGCVMCMRGAFARKQRNVYTEELTQYAPQKLWALTSFSGLDREQLEIYLQRCVLEFARSRGKLTVSICDAIRAQLKIEVPPP